LHIRQYVWDGWESVALLLGTSGAVLESWTRGVGLAGDIGTLVAVTHHSGSTPGTYYTHHNHRGDVVLTRRGTTTVGRYDYSAFGNLKSAIGTDVCRFQFSSKERDPATGWSYYGYRYYAPTWQRWVSADPIGEAGGVNLYGFVGNAPVDTFDPHGLQFAGSSGWPQEPNAPGTGPYVWLWREGPLKFCRANVRRNCDAEFLNCSGRGILFCNLVTKGRSTEERSFCLMVYGAACYMQREQCKQWNLANGFAP
jgi:RHS repeat-associated protein